MDIAKLKAARDELTKIIAEAEGSNEPVAFEKKPLPPDAIPAYHGCRALWEAAQKEGKFDIFAYIPGLQPRAAHITHLGSPEEMNADIVKIGFTVWGQDWLSKDENCILLNPDYQRHFVGYQVVRKNQHDHTQGYNRIP